jgi:hypothetical protein
MGIESKDVYAIHSFRKITSRGNAYVGFVVVAVGH